MLRFIFLLTLSFLYQNILFALDLQEMTLEEKVGQLLMVHFHGQIANEDARFLIQDLKAGSMIYYNWSNGLTSPEQVKALSSGLQAIAEANSLKIPLLIAVDQEGGIVARLTSGFTIFPGNMALGMTEQPNLAEDCAWAIGQELRAVGVTMNLAPVVDVNTNPKNPVIGLRAFGNSPHTVIAFGEKTLLGYKKAKILTTLKHFPGHGDVDIDSHTDLPIINKSLEELEQTDLFPFAKLAGKSDAVLTAHILVPAFDPENCSTLSAKTLAYLREQIGFQGVIIADSLVMDGVLKKCHSVDEAAIQALNAGCDLLILGGKQLIGSHDSLELSIKDIQRIHSSLMQAVNSGRITKHRLDQAVERILQLKERYKEILPVDLQVINSESHRLLSNKIAALALKTISRNTDAIQNLEHKKICLFAPQLLENNIQNTFLQKMSKTPLAFFFKDLNPLKSEIKLAIEYAKLSDIIIVCSYNAWKNPSQIEFIRSLLDTKKPVILVVARDPYDACFFPDAHLVYIPYSPTIPSLNAVCNEINKI